MPSKHPRLACLGDLMLDIVVRAEAGIEPGTDVASSVRFRVGGSAANTARAFAALGGEAKFVGAVGDDGLGRRLTTALRAAGVRVHAVRVRGHSPRLIALIDASGERSFLTDRGVADKLTAASLNSRWLAQLDALHMPAYSLLHSPLADTALAAARLFRGGGGALVSVDLASQRPLLAIGKDVAMQRIRAVTPDLLFANSSELKALVGRRAAHKLLELAPVAVVKEGSSGCRVLWTDTSARGWSEIDVATKRVAARDTTGAGDAFDAGFLYSLIASDYRPTLPRGVALFRRAALAGHRAATRLLTSPRKELAL